MGVRYLARTDGGGQIDSWALHWSEVWLEGSIDLGSGHWSAVVSVQGTVAAVTGECCSHTLCFVTSHGCVVNKTARDVS